MYATSKMTRKAYLSKTSFSYEECTYNMKYIYTHYNTPVILVQSYMAKKVKSKGVQLCEEITAAITQYLSFRYFNYWLWREISGQVMSNARNFWCLLNNIWVVVKNNVKKSDLPFLNLYRYSNPQTNQTAESLQHTEESLWLAKITTYIIMKTKFQK